MNFTYTVSYVSKIIRLAANIVQNYRVAAVLNDQIKGSFMHLIENTLAKIIKDLQAQIETSNFLVK